MCRSIKREAEPEAEHHIWYLDQLRGVYQTLNLVPGEGKRVILFLQVKHERKTQLLSEVLHARYQFVTDVAINAKIHGTFLLLLKNPRL